MESVRNIGGGIHIKLVSVKWGSTADIGWVTEVAGTRSCDDLLTNAETEMKAAKPIMCYLK